MRHKQARWRLDPGLAAHPTNRLRGLNVATAEVTEPARTTGYSPIITSGQLIRDQLWYPLLLGHAL